MIRSQQAKDDRRKLALCYGLNILFMICKFSCKSWELNPDTHKSVLSLAKELELVPGVLTESSLGSSSGHRRLAVPQGSATFGQAVN